jgi:hypothetical protein
MLMDQSKMLTGRQDANSPEPGKAGFPPVFWQTAKLSLPHNFLAPSRREGVKVLKLVVSRARARELHKARAGPAMNNRQRHRLPNRRPAETNEITATIGRDRAYCPAEVFPSRAKDGSGLVVIVGDTLVVISIALQHGISPRAFAKSVRRAPDGLGRITAASLIGAALDLLV